MSTPTEPVKAPSGSEMKKDLVKGLFIILYFFISYITAMVIFFVVIIQYALNLIFQKPNAHLLTFGRTLSIYIADVISFLTYNEEQMPFPFKPWPKDPKNNLY